MHNSVNLAVFNPLTVDVLHVSHEMMLACSASHRKNHQKWPKNGI